MSSMLELVFLLVLKGKYQGRVGLYDVQLTGTLHTGATVTSPIGYHSELPSQIFLALPADAASECKHVAFSTLSLEIGIFAAAVMT